MTATQKLIEQFGLVGLESPLDEMEQSFLGSVHRFAEEVLRPAGVALDRMSPEEVIAEGSPLWQVFSEFAKLGITPELMASLEPLQAARMYALLMEEMAWGDSGLAVALGVAGTPQRLAHHFNNQFLIDNIPEDAIG